MKQIDNRQKQQVQSRAEKFFGKWKGFASKDKAGIPNPPGKPEKPSDQNAASIEPIQHTPFVRQEPRVGRNEPCPCGSGKKYKKCCLLKGAIETRAPEESKPKRKPAKRAASGKKKPTRPRKAP